MGKKTTPAPRPDRIALDDATTAALTSGQEVMFEGPDGGDYVIHRADEVYTPNDFMQHPRRGITGKVDSSRFEIIHEEGVTVVSLLDCAGFTDSDGSPIPCTAWTMDTNDSPADIFLGQNAPASSWGRAIADLLGWGGNVTDEPTARATPPAAGDDPRFSMIINGAEWTVRRIGGNSGFVHIDRQAKEILLGSDPEWDRFASVMLEVLGNGINDSAMVEYAFVKP